MISDHTIKHLLDDAKVLTNYLFSRHYPWEEEDLRERVASFKEDVKSRSNYCTLFLKFLHVSLLKN